MQDTGKNLILQITYYKTGTSYDQVDSGLCI